MLNTLQKNFRVKPLTVAVASVISLTTASFAFAQEEADEIIVTGIKASLQQAMDIKRDSAGVVDAINAEDMGKFPDTNLAESLQRITGVSIDRNNGEGSRITVRGFGPEYNMVTLNGRTLPTGSAYGGGGTPTDAAARGGNSRAFDFANLASESISGVEVYKTGKANVTAGGIGASVNIKTARPLDTSGFRATIGGKAVMDSTNRTGDDVTPEVSGLVSWSDDAGVFGVSLTASYQERDSGSTGITVNDWAVAEWGGGTTNTIYDNKADSAIFKNAPTTGQLYSRPNDVRYVFSDQERDRTNAQLTFQYRPFENLTATLDYTYAQKNQSEHRGEVTTWVQNGSNITNVEFDNSAIKTPKFISEQYSSPKDVGFAQQYREQEDTLESTGLNIDWAVNDQLTISLDAHHSTMESLPTAPGHASELDVGVGASIKTGANWQFSGATIPTWTHTLNGTLGEEDLSSSVMRIFSTEQLSEVDQAKIDAKWKFDDGSRFDFGLERREMGSNTVNYNSNNAQILGGWGASAPGEFVGAGLWEPFDVAGEFKDVSTGNSPHIGYRADARELAAYLVTKYPTTEVTPTDPLGSGPAYIGIKDTQSPKGIVRNSAGNNDIQEDTDAVYFQLGTTGQIGGVEVDVLAGLRYETTKQVSSSDTPPRDYFVWQSDNDFVGVNKAAGAKSTAKNNYDALLPNLDISVKLTDDIVTRFSYSKTIARPGLASLGSSTTLNQPNGSTLNAGTTVQATGQNPQLKPLESSNFDVSLEWYFDDASYVSAGVFEKRVLNFVGNEQVVRTFDVRDQTAGPRAQAARAALNSRGINVDNGSLYAMMQILANPTQYPTGAAAYTPELADDLNDQSGYSFITPNADDPLMKFTMNSPVNNREAKIYGAEFAGQHFFGDTGFGLQANYTIVRGDVKFDNMNITDNQFALLGLSDTANLVLMYEKYGVEARLAYNWRDEFLNRTGVGSKNPDYVEAYSQIDANVTYHFTDNLAVSLEAINLTGEDRRDHGRNDNMVLTYDDLGARYQLGVRYNF